MSFTARGRMLSATISLDAAVDGLPCVEAKLLFTWMLAHADNLGRMRGDPAWVLAAVFPRRQHEYSPAQIDEWLLAMQSAGLLALYVAEGMQFVQFRSWEKHQKLSGNSKRASSLPDPQDPSSVRRTDAVRTPSVPGPCPVPTKGREGGREEASSSLRSSDAPSGASGNPVEIVDNPQGKLRIFAMVKGLGQALSISDPPPFPNDAAWAWITTELKPRDPRGVMGFMGWAWKHLGRDLDAIKAMVIEWRDKRVENPRAYFAEGGAGGCRMATAASDRGEAEGEEFKRLDRAFLAGGASSG